MIQYNSTSLEVSYIKQLLSSFNLPTAHVYSDTSQINALVNHFYIKDGYITEYVGDGKYLNIHPYTFNSKIKYYTTNLVSPTNNYDSATHEYLGDYLRFLRDYAGVNLMPLYNCFYPRYVQACEIKFNNDEGKKVVFNAEDETYKLIVIPVKFGQEYTIHINCADAELCCCFFGRSFYTLRDSAAVDPLITSTYQKINSANYAKGVTITSLKTIAFSSEDYACEKDLKMILKLPRSFNSSIFIEEGNLSTLSEDLSIENPLSTTVSTRINSYCDSEGNELSDEYWSKHSDFPILNSLTQWSTDKSFPFSDRLFEYLTSMAITPLDTNGDNIKRIQKAMYDNFQEHRINSAVYLKAEDGSAKLDTSTRSSSSGLAYLPRYYGIWYDKYKPMIYETMLKSKKSNKKDILGYLDKDAEQEIGSETNIYATEGNKW